ncbi:MAG: 50S ribosomal protein L3 N(5)-glutamine methyltransferase [Gammaproteobacteria bacterium]|nr:MAG: 50S ribosomal protein L3 N(5)-glutamine methyltransferase [Gammaproteobacteria bacterium]
MKIDSEIACRDLSTLRDMVRWAISRFMEYEVFLGHGYEDPWDEALQLVFLSVYLPVDIDPKVFDARLTQTEKELVVENIRRRVEERCPTAYITRQAWFAGLPFYVDERVIVPRSPIAELIESDFSPWLAGVPNSVLDLCCGSACIGIACAMQFPDASVSAADISEDALDVAQINCTNFELEDSLSLVQSDLFSGLTGQTFDLIVSNPPYVDDADIQSMPQEYHHEPSLSLGAGQDGLSIVRKILAQAADFLNDEGVLVVEVGNSQYALNDAFPTVPFLWLEFERGGDGVFLLEKRQLIEFKNQFALTV